MKVVNIHHRVIQQPKEKIAQLLSTLATKEDKIWPYEKWPAIRFKKGLQLGASGGHGPIKYTVTQHIPGEYIHFTFDKPTGFNGYHALKIKPIDENSTEIRHILKMNTTGIDILTWALTIRWLHDALIEDAFDKIENYFSKVEKVSSWGLWVKLWRKLLAPKAKS